ncbi:MAG TPA: FHA domain-containing protein, partial [Tepidisphaeraceae bacterium]|nr:FHA domain-containing protein [Tepidisphaeraceae bacterium]
MSLSVTLSIQSPGGSAEERLDPAKLESGTFTVGRHQECALFVNDLTVSRRHCKLTVKDGRLHVEDLGSASGTFLNDRQLAPNVPTAVGDGDVLRLGDVTITARIPLDKARIAEERTVVRPASARSIAAPPVTSAAGVAVDPLDPFAKQAPAGETDGGVLASGAAELPVGTRPGSRVGPVVDKSPAPPVASVEPGTAVVAGAAMSETAVVPPGTEPASAGAPVAPAVATPPPPPPPIPARGSAPPALPNQATGAAPAAPQRPARAEGMEQTVFQPARKPGAPEPQPAGSTGTGKVTIDLNRDAVTLGRDKTVADVALESLAVSRRHARVTRTAAGAFVIEDLRSTNGTYVNGTRLTAPHTLVKGDVIALGGEHLAFDGARLVTRKAGGGFEIVLRDVGRTVPHRETGQPLSLLRGVNLTINPGEFVALLGPSGAGKSVLMKAISGRERANQGEIRYDKENFYDRFGSFAVSIGYAPQKDIFHDTLRVVDALRYSSKLRLAKDVTDAEIDQNIDRVLGLVGLTPKKNDVIKRLSGGQQKRVTIAMELLSNPKVLFLDEVTSPLDPATEKEVMGVFRDLSREGVTVICITHHANSASLCDQVAFVHDGLLTFYGPPADFKKHFEIETIEDAYGSIKKHPGQHWRDRYTAGEAHRQFVTARDPRGAGQAGPAAPVQDPEFGRAQFFRQLRLLTKRYVHTMLMDVKTPAILIGMAPMVAMLVCVMVGGIKGDDLLNWAKKQKILCFGEIVTALFLSLFGSIREIVREQDVYEHEHLICVRPLPYLLSKVLPLFLIGAIQCALIVLVINVGGGIEAGNVVGQYVIVLFASWVGTLVGLTISAGVRDGEKAVMLMIAIVIPMILFSGAFAPMKGLSGFIAGTFCASYWAMQGLMGMTPTWRQDALRTPTPMGPGEDFAGFWGGAAMMVLHMVIAFALAYYFLVRRDGRGALGRIMGGIKKAFAGGAKRPGPPMPALAGGPVGYGSPPPAPQGYGPQGYAPNPYAAPPAYGGGGAPQGFAPSPYG